MPTNSNTFNSRVTSEALEAKFRQVFPAQGGAELVQDLFASGVIQPVVDFSSVAEGSVLPEFLQTAWDFATSAHSASNTTTTCTSTPGFWKVSVVVFMEVEAAANREALVRINDGLGNKTIWRASESAAVAEFGTAVYSDFYAFLRSGDSLNINTNGGGTVINAVIRQVADVNGNLVNPLGFTFT